MYIVHSASHSVGAFFHKDQADVYADLLNGDGDVKLYKVFSVPVIDDPDFAPAPQADEEEDDSISALEALFADEEVADDEADISMEECDGTYRVVMTVTDKEAAYTAAHGVELFLSMPGFRDVE